MAIKFGMTEKRRKAGAMGLDPWIAYQGTRVGGVTVLAPDGGGSEPEPEPAAPMTFDANNAAPIYTLSNDDLTAETTDASGGAILATRPFGSGNRMIRGVVTALTEAEDFEEACIALALPGFDPTVLDGSLAHLIFVYANDGTILRNDGGPSVSGLPTFGAGEGARMLYKPATGQVWCGNDDTISGDPEAGTGEAFSITPGTIVTPAAYCYSNDGVTPVGMTLDPTASSGSYLAGNDP